MLSHVYFYDAYYIDNTRSNAQRLAISSLVLEEKCRDNAELVAYYIGHSLLTGRLSQNLGLLEIVNIFVGA